MYRSIIILSTLLVTACGPQYKTEYSYVRPTTPDGQTCAVQCQNTQLLCKQNKSLEIKTCQAEQRQAQLEYDLCVKDNEGKANKDKTLCSYPTAQYCGNEFQSEQSCVADYNQCYTNCGGIVDSQTICVANCD